MAAGETRALALVTVFAAGCSTTNVTNVYQTVPDGGDAARPASEAGGGDATVAPDAPADGAIETSDAMGLTDAGADVACTDVLPPPKPVADDPSDAGNQTFVAAMHTLDLGVRPDGGAPPLFGYDLDDVDTCCSGAPGSCAPPVVGTKDCDEVGGRDNSGGQFIANLALLDPTVFNATTISERLQDGVYSLLIQIQSYNGQPNDTQVVAAIYASDGLETVGDAAPPPAKWDGTDVWSVDQAFVLSGGNGSPIVPTDYDAHAYVSNGTLVMQVNFPLSLGTTSTGAITIALTGGVITAQLEPAGDGTFHLTNGQVAGRWNVSSVLAAAQSLTLAGQSICPGSTLYGNIKEQICTAADIATTPTADNTGAACDALSIGLGFTADPAHMGNVVAGSPTSGPCGDASIQPDDCATP